MRNFHNGVLTPMVHDDMVEIFKEHKLLAIILLGGFVLRIWGIFWGIPFPDPLEGDYHPDERIVMKGAVEFPTHILTNQEFFYPTFFHYFLGLITLPLRFLFDDFTVPLHGEIGSEYYYVVTVVGRLCSALAGTGAIALTYVLAKEIYDRKRALLASALLAFTFYHVNNAAFGTTDVLTSFLLVICLLVFRLAFLHPHSSVYFLWSGVCLGLLVGTKYTGALACLALMVLYGDVILKRFRHAGKGRSLNLQKLHFHLLVCGLTAVVTFFLTTPGILLHVQGFMESFEHIRGVLAQHSHSRTDSETWMTVFLSVGLAVGFPLAIAFLFGLVLPYSRNVYDLSFMAILIVFFWYFEATLPPRYVIFVAPLIAMIASNGLWWVYERGGRYAQACGAALMAVVVFYSVGYCLEGAYARHDDTRTKAAHFVAEHIPLGTTIGIGYSSDKYKTVMSWRRPRLDSALYRVVDFIESPEVVIITSLDFDYIQKTLDSEKFSERYVLKEEFQKEWWGLSPPSPQIFRFYDELLSSPQDAGYELIATFEKPNRVFVWEDQADARVGSRVFRAPEVRIYRSFPSRQLSVQRESL